MANGTTKRAPTGVVGTWKPVADPVGAAVAEAPSCDACMWAPLLQLVAICCPDGCDEVSATGKGLGRPGGSGLHTPASGDVDEVLPGARVTPGRPRKLCLRTRRTESDPPTDCDSVPGPGGLSRIPATSPYPPSVSAVASR